MADYLKRQDYIDLKVIDEETLNELTQFDDNALPNISRVIYDDVAGYLNARFDAAAELAKTGTNRHGSVLYHATCLGAYKLHKRISPNAIPDNVVDGYIEAKDWFEKVNAGTIVPLNISTHSDGERDFIKYGGETRRDNRI